MAEGALKKVFYGWWVVVACFTISLYVGGVVFFGFTAFFEPIRDELGWSYTQISLASSIRGLETGLFAPFVGFLVSRHGSRRILLAGMLTLGVGLLLLSRVQSLLSFYSAFLLISFGAGGCASLVTMSAVANWFHKNIGLALGIVASGFGASGLIVPVIVKLISAWGWRPTLFILGVGGILLGIPLCMVIRDRPETGGGPPNGEKTPESEGADQGPGTGFREALRSASFLYLNAAEATRLMIVTAVIIHIMPYLQHAGIERQAAGAVAASLPLVSIVGRFGFGWLSDRYPKRVVMSVSYMSMGAGLIAYCFVQTAWVLILFVLLFSPGFGGGMVLRGAIVRDYFGKESFGKLLGVMMGVASIGGIVGPTLVGWGFDTLGSYVPMWVALSAFTFLTSIMVLRIRPGSEVGSKEYGVSSGN